MKLPLLIFACAAAAATPLWAAAVPAAAWDAPTMPDATAAIRAGHAPVDSALARIIPAPYRIELDRSVAKTTQLAWSSGDNWMTVLQRAIAPLGLVADPDWSRNTIRIVRVPPPRPVTPFVPSPAALATSVATTMPLAKATTVSTTTTTTAAIAPRSTFSAPLPAHTVPAAPISKAFTLPVGKRLSEGLSEYAKTFGWQMRWQVTQDYVLDAPLPIPDGTLESGLKYVLRAYQAQGGLLNVTFVLANPNRVAVARLTTAAEHRE